MALTINLKDIRLSAAQQKLVSDNLKLVDHVAKNYRWVCEKHGIDYEFLQSEGRIGLIRAAYRYDADSGNSFSSLAIPFIKGEINHLVARDLELIKTPRDKASLRITSLDVPTQIEDTTLLDFIPDVLGVKTFEISEELAQSLDLLPRVDREILIMTQVNGVTNKDVGRWLELSPITVARRIEKSLVLVKQAIENDSNLKVRKQIRKREALPYVDELGLHLPDKHECVVCSAIFGVWRTPNPYIPKTCSNVCAASLGRVSNSVAKTWSEKELKFCLELVGKYPLEDIYTKLYIHNKTLGLPLRTKKSVKVKITRLVKTVKCTSDNYTMHGLARLLGVKRDRVRYWVRQGFLIPERTSNNQCKINKELFYQFAVENKWRLCEIDVDKLAAILEDRELALECSQQLPHIKAIEVFRSDTKKVYKSVRECARETGVVRQTLFKSGWLKPSNYTSHSYSGRDNPIDYNSLQDTTELLDPKISSDKKWSFVNPEGVVYTTNNLALLAKVHGLLRSGLANTWAKRQNSHAGWTANN